jgi:hypothetical protein
VGSIVGPAEIEPGLRDGYVWNISGETALSAAGSRKASSMEDALVFVVMAAVSVSGVLVLLATSLKMDD